MSISENALEINILEFEKKTPSQVTPGNIDLFKSDPTEREENHLWLRLNNVDKSSITENSLKPSDKNIICYA